MPKTLEEKIDEIKAVLEKEKITWQEINSHADYCVIQRMLKGKKIRETSADKLLDKIKIIKNKRRKKAKKSIEEPAGVKEIEIESVIEDDICRNKLPKVDDIEKSITPQLKVEEFFPPDTGALIDCLKAENQRLNQKNLTLQGEIEQKIRENQHLRELLDKSKTVIEPSITVKEQQKSVIEDVKRHEQMIKEVVEKIENLERQIVIEKSIARKEKNPAYHGFSVCRLSSGYWQAVRRLDGKPNCVYIGRDLSLAEEKIEKWLKENHPEILKEGILRTE